jgi:arabinose-5-phosphate isomerase
MHPLSPNQLENPTDPFGIASKPPFLPSFSSQVLDQNLDLLVTKQISGLSLALKTFLSPGLARDHLKETAGLLVSTIRSQRKILVTGVGKSAAIGKKIVATLNSFGFLSLFLDPTDALHGDVGLVKPLDLLWIFSYSGVTFEVAKLLDHIQGPLGIEVNCIGIGRSRLSLLAKRCKYWLEVNIDQEACPLNLAPTTSAAATLAIADTVCLLTQQEMQLTGEDFAKFHPQGSLGFKLTTKASEIMVPADNCHAVTAHTPFVQIALAISENKLGATPVIDLKTQQLLGIITDGDLRRAVVKNKENPAALLGLLANHFMTTHPIFVHPDASLQQTLHLMENRPSQISILPVLNSAHQLLGMVRLHDIVQHV